MKPTRRTVRLHSRKPITREMVKTAPKEEVLQLFNTFISEARRELRKRERLTVKGMMHKTDCDSVTFLGETFSLTIDFTEGFVL